MRIISRVEIAIMSYNKTNGSGPPPKPTAYPPLYMISFSVQKINSITNKILFSLIFLVSNTMDIRLIEMHENTVFSMLQYVSKSIIQPKLVVLSKVEIKPINIHIKRNLVSLVLFDNDLNCLT